MEDVLFLCSSTQCISYITCITQVALKFVRNTLLVYNRRLFLLYFKLLLDLVANKNWLNDCARFLAKIFELSLS